MIEVSELPNLILPCAIGGLILGVLSYIPQFRPIVILINIGSILGLFGYVFYAISYLQNTTVEGFQVFVYTLIPFAVTEAITAKGEEIGRSLADRFSFN